MDAAGNLYGTASIGGGGNGLVFKLDPRGKQTIFYNFPGGADGIMLFPSGLLLDELGNLYGTTYQGGDLNIPGIEYTCGVIYNYSRPRRLGERPRPAKRLCSMRLRTERAAVNHLSSVLSCEIEKATSTA